MRDITAMACGAHTHGRRFRSCRKRRARSVRHVLRLQLLRRLVNRLRRQRKARRTSGNATPYRRAQRRDAAIQAKRYRAVRRCRVSARPRSRRARAVGSRTATARRTASSPSTDDGGPPPGNARPGAGSGTSPWTYGRVALWSALDINWAALALSLATTDRVLQPSAHGGGVDAR
jgi:hypothetical protein